MPFFFYDPKQNPLAEPLDREALLARLEQIADTQDLFITALHSDIGLSSYVQALREVCGDRELPANAGGFIPQDGPWAGDHDNTLPEPGTYSHGTYQIYDAVTSGSVIGQLLMIPNDYAPLSGKSWPGREYWRWSGSSWPDLFVLKAETMNTGSSSAWTGYSHGAFSAPSGSINPTTGTLYEIRQLLQSSGPPGSVIGVLWRKTSGDLLWLAKQSALNANNLLSWPGNSKLSFEKLTGVPDGINDLWRYSAPKLYP